jgi:hypothetical protein
VTNLTKARLTYLLLIASLFAYLLAGAVGAAGMSSGGGF